MSELQDLRKATIYAKDALEHLTLVFMKCPPEDPQIEPLLTTRKVLLLAAQEAALKEYAYIDARHEEQDARNVEMLEAHQQMAAALTRIAAVLEKRS